jgi:hypothetical protein
MNKPVVVLLLAALSAAPALARAQGLPSSEQNVPPGFGTFKQEDLQIALATPSIEIRFMPLDPRVINLLSPDAYQAISVLFKNNRPRIDSAAHANAISRPGVAFVSFYGLAPGASYDATTLSITVHGRLLRSLAIIPYTPNFTNGRLEPRQLVSAFYVFEEQIPVLEPFTLQYQNQFSTEWTSNRVANINLERQRAMLRASKGSSTVSDVPPTPAPTR